jgi:hypothetical protein
MFAHTQRLLSGHKLPGAQHLRGLMLAGSRVRSPTARAHAHTQARAVQQRVPRSARHPRGPGYTSSSLLLAFAGGFSCGASALYVANEYKAWSAQQHLRALHESAESGASCALVSGPLYTRVGAFLRSRVTDPATFSSPDRRGQLTMPSSASRSSSSPHDDSTATASVPMPPPAVQSSSSSPSSSSSSYSPSSSSSSSPSPSSSSSSSADSAASALSLPSASSAALTSAGSVRVSRELHEESMTNTSTSGSKREKNKSKSKSERLMKVANPAAPLVAWCTITALTALLAAYRVRNAYHARQFFGRINITVSSIQVGVCMCVCVCVVVVFACVCVCV